MAWAPGKSTNAISRNLSQPSSRSVIPDLVVEDKIIIDTKVVAAFNENHSAQMLGYLAITGLELAILLNFKYAKLEWKRLAKSRLLSE